MDKKEGLIHIKHVVEQNTDPESPTHMVMKNAGKDMDKLVAEIKKLKELPPLWKLIEEKQEKIKVSYTDIADRAYIGRTTINKIRNNKMRPTKDMMIRIAFAMGFDAADTQELLKSAKCTQFSVSAGDSESVRDALIMNGLNKHIMLEEMDEILESQGLPCLIPAEKLK